MENGYSSWKSSLLFGDGIPHYYGDTVRQLFIATAVLSFIVVPLWGDLLPFVGVVPQVAAALLLVLLAGFTSAHNQLVMIANATVSGVSVLLIESTAIALRGQGEHASALFYAREAAVLLLIAALYFSIKTIRAMMTGKLGHADTSLEFDEPIQTHEDTSVQANERSISDYDGD